MKTKLHFFMVMCGVFYAHYTFSQVTQPTNAVSNANSYLGTSNNFDVQFKRNNIPAGKLSTTYTNYGVNSFATPNSVSIGIGAGQFSTGIGGNTYIGQNAGKGTSATINNSGVNNTFIGFNSGILNTSGISNLFSGYNSGLKNTAGSQNVYLGAYTGGYNDVGSGNVHIGYGSGSFDFDGFNNVFIGKLSGSSSGDGNTFVGSYSGYNLDEGFNNTFIGQNSGSDLLQGSGNILIGSNSGPNTGDAIINDKLYVDNIGGNNPLIWGDFAEDKLKFNGKVCIGIGIEDFPINALADVSNYNLCVKGGILTEELLINLQSNWADYVFEKEYKLPTLQEVENHIIEKGHLINVPSAKEVAENGIKIGEMTKIQQEKIEELTLYIIELNKKIEALEKKILNN
jgi:hypothetical protein